jgi:hypothetical protein
VNPSPLKRLRDWIQDHLRNPQCRLVVLGRPAMKEEATSYAVPGLPAMPAYTLRPAIYSAESDDADPPRLKSRCTIHCRIRRLAGRARPCCQRRQNYRERKSICQVSRMRSLLEQTTIFSVPDCFSTHICVMPSAPVPSVSRVSPDSNPTRTRKESIPSLCFQNMPNELLERCREGPLRYRLTLDRWWSKPVRNAVLATSCPGASENPLTPRYLFVANQRKEKKRKRKRVNICAGGLQSGLTVPSRPFDRPAVV